MEWLFYEFFTLGSHEALVFLSLCVFYSKVLGSFFIFQLSLFGAFQTTASIRPSCVYDRALVNLSALC